MTRREILSRGDSAISGGPCSGFLSLDKKGLSHSRFFEVDTSCPPRPPHIGACWSVVSPRPPDCPRLFTTSFTVFEKFPVAAQMQSINSFTQRNLRFATFVATMGEYLWL